MTSDKQKQDIDQHTGVETTGHEWDGIKELNNPLPRWWLWVLYASCIWAVGYWIVYPAWPTLSGEGERGGTKGAYEWTQYSQLKEQQADIVARKAGYLEKFHASDFDKIKNDPELYAFAIAGGKAAFKDNCATCHGTGGSGAKGYPNLNDDDWLWGGTTEEIYKTIKYGIRSNHEDTNNSVMPVFAEILEREEIEKVAAYVFALSQGEAGDEAGRMIFERECASCHGVDGTGDHEKGAPNLADAIWFYSEGDVASITKQIQRPKHGMMPNWDERLDDDTIRQLTIYVHSLGGGE